MFEKNEGFSTLFVRFPLQDIRNILAKELPEVDGVPKIMVHYINMVRKFCLK